jgi:NADH:ubiquinone oxidoreductase subunit B-like Fe-S oxidoreductase
LLASAIKGAEVVMGSNPHWRREYDTVICVGACTYKIAKEGKYTYIPGCPPTQDDLYENLP